MAITYIPVREPVQPEKPKSKSKVSKMKMRKIDFKEVLKYIHLLSTGLSFGAGILGMIYLNVMGLPMEVAGIFGVGVIIVHMGTMRGMIK